VTKTNIATARAPRPAGSYSQGVVANGFLYTAGFGPQDPDTGAVAESVGDQTRQVLENVRAVVTEAGVSLDDVVKVTTHLQHLQRDFAEYDAVYQEFFTEPFPVRTTVGSDLMNILVEIDVVVALREAP
jgi:2-iminobutanoate/2-iminopropanoate deaminase